VAQLEAAATEAGLRFALRSRPMRGSSPAGRFTFLGKKPTGEDVRHQELVGKLERLTQEIALLRGSQPPARALV